MSIFDGDSDGDSVTFGPMGSKVWNLYHRVRELVDLELMEFTEDELHMINLLYGDNFVYPINNHITQLLTGAPEDEVIH